MDFFAEGLLLLAIISLIAIIIIVLYVNSTQRGKYNKYLTAFSKNTRKYVIKYNGITRKFKCQKHVFEYYNIKNKKNYLTEKYVRDIMSDELVDEYRNEVFNGNKNIEIKFMTDKLRSKTYYFSVQGFIRSFTVFNKLLGVEFVLEDITAVKESEKKLFETEEYMKQAMTSGSVCMWNYSFKEGLIEFPEDAQKILELNLESSNNTILINDFAKNIHNKDSDRFLKWITRDAKKHYEEPEIFKYIKEDLSEIFLKFSSKSYDIDNSKKVMGIFNDITSQIKNNKKIEIMAYHDSLTKLYNRPRMIEIIDNYCKYNKKTAALMFLDLDFFKQINDVYGHEIGDELLIEIGKRLIDNILPNSNIGRVAGDEFLILLREIKSKEEAENYAKKLLGLINTPIKLKDITIYSSATIGIAYYPEHGDSRSKLFVNADSAMYFAKSQGRNTYYIYNEEIKRDIKNKYELIYELKNAIKEKEFVLHYQPIFDVRNNKVIALEALVRWDSPKRGMVYPNDFIGVCEEAGLINELGDIIIDMALDTKKYIDETIPKKQISITINISSKQLENKLFGKTLFDKIVKRNILLQEVATEVTESMVMNDNANVLNNFNYLIKNRIRVIMDDFGSGYSSLSVLNKFDYAIIKIDREFIMNIHNEDDEQYLEKIIGFLHSLKNTVIAEGIETEYQRDLIYKMGCSLMQGYFFAKPKEFKDIEELLISNGRNRIR